MKFHLMSDLHLEFADLKLPGGEVLLLSGDITCANYLRADRTDKNARKLNDRCKAFFFEECAKYKSVYYVMGNHEHYTGVWEDTQSELKKFLEGSNVVLLEKEWTNLGNDTFLWGATLWTDLNKNNSIAVHAAKYGMNDYRWISKYRPPTGAYGKLTGKTLGTLDPQETMLDHTYALAGLNTFLEQTGQPDKKVIVMTHMAPCHKSSKAEKYGSNNPLNYAYYSELSELVLNNPQIKVWVHGHTHDTHDYMIGDTRVLCNPRGYANEQRPLMPENLEFDINFSFEV